jgi:drug/metabolite transporter (DMT)-like permease
MHARPLDAFAATLVFALCVVWGFNQVVVKLALPDVGPIAQTGIRSGVGALCVIAYALFTKRRIFQIDGTEAAGALAGALFTAEFIALYESLRFTTAARATVFIYSAPFFVAVGAAFLLREERLRPIQWAGLAFAFLGVACGFVGRTKGGSLTGDALALLAAVLWAATTIVIKATPLRRIDPIKVLLYQIGFAALAAPLAAFAFGEAPPTHLTTTTVASLLWQGVAVAGVSYALWFWTLTRYAVAELSAFTFITPLVGVLAGWLVFGETITGAFALAIVLVIAGLALVNWPRGAISPPRPAACRAGRRDPE